MEVNDILGKKFGNLLVLKRNGSDSGGHAMWLCICDCGKHTVVRGSHLRSSSTLSCGCEAGSKAKYKYSSSKKNIYTRRLYNIWFGMKRRCENVSCKDYRYYGGRGISICEAWKDFDSFCEWSLNNGYKDNLTIDRIDNDGNYEPSNCRWVTMEVQFKNKRKRKAIRQDD
jgi:hypothetical protein